VKPCLARPLFLTASACASILAAVGALRTKLQLLQPIGGVAARPLSSALAAGASANTANAASGNANRRTRSS
jgi:hypothetical protein